MVTTSYDGKLTVLTEQGPLNGAHYRTANRKQVFAFFGVPYAAPPVGKFRFREPQPLKSWSHVRLALQKRSICLQLNHFLIIKNPGFGINGNEDCLYLNIFTPKIYKQTDLIEENKLLDVLVFIHGGAFTYGNANECSGKYLLDKADIIFVSVAYRVGPFGFLSLEDDVIPGNNGLKDQVAALNWVKKNIMPFGGNPNKITIAGSSAGGVSVHLHYLSKLSRNLFSRGISLSGTALCPWGLMKNAREKAIRLAESLHCNTTDSLSILQCLQKVSSKDIIRNIRKLFITWYFNPFSPFGPTVEKKTVKNAFLDEHPLEMLKNNNVKDAPWLVSFTEAEGLYPAAEYLHKNHILQAINKNWNEILPLLLFYNYTITSKEEQIELSKKIRNEYLPDVPFIALEQKELVDLIGDRLFYHPITKALKLHSMTQKSPVYAYKFSHKSNFSVSTYLSQNKNVYGVCHGDDTTYTLACCHKQTRMLPNTKEMVDKMTHMWINFMKYNRPYIVTKNEIFDYNWIPVCKDNSEEPDRVDYLNIRGPDKMEMMYNHSICKKYKFWDTFSSMENYR